jgi:integrase
MDTKWKGLAAKSRETTVDALTGLLFALTADKKGWRPDVREARHTLRRWYLCPSAREPGAETPPPQAARALEWMISASLTIASTLDDPVTLRAALDAMSTQLNGKRYAPDVIKRRRRVITNFVRFAIEQKEMVNDPFTQIQWTPPRTSTRVDRRRVPNPRQVAELLIAVSYIGTWERCRGRRLVAFFGCMYYAMMRPEEVIGLRGPDCDLPEKGWGELVFAKARPVAGKQWTDSGELHDDKALKQRADDEPRHVPIPPVLVKMLREHIAAFGLSTDKRIFGNERGTLLSGSTYSRVWQEARALALTPDRYASQLAAEPYDLRHAGVSLGLRSTNDPALIAERAGHSVEVLMARYAWALDDKDKSANKSIEDALGAG